MIKCSQKRFLNQNGIIFINILQNVMHLLFKNYLKFIVNSCNYFVSLNNVSQHHHHLDYQHISQQLEFFTMNDFEIIGFENKTINLSGTSESSKNEILDLLKQNIKKNINFSTYFKKKKNSLIFLIFSQSFW